MASVTIAGGYVLSHVRDFLQCTRGKYSYLTFSMSQNMPHWTSSSKTWDSPLRLDSALVRSSSSYCRINVVLWDIRLSLLAANVSESRLCIFFGGCFCGLVGTTRAWRCCPRSKRNSLRANETWELRASTVPLESETRCTPDDIEAFNWTIQRIDNHKRVEVAFRAAWMLTSPKANHFLRAQALNLSAICLVS